MEAGRTSAVDAVVCVPTFRRPAMLAATLRSLAAQRTARLFAVVVVDNDARERAGLTVAERAFQSGDLVGAALVEPEQGNCSAINAALRAALRLYPAATYLMMIDDDEIARPDWLERMVCAAERSGAEVVGGPVHPVFAAPPSPAIARHPVFHPAYDRSGPVPRIYGSGNFLIRREALLRLAEPGFHGSFNHLGGGDTDFFLRCMRAGFRFFWESEAVIEETVPPARTGVGWIVRRCLRTGAINFRVEHRNAGSRIGRLRAHAKTLLSIPFGVGRGLACLACTGSPLLASQRPLEALGRVLAGVGIVPEQYRAGPGR